MTLPVVAMIDCCRTAVGVATVVIVAATGVVVGTVVAVVGIVTATAAAALGHCQPWSILSGKTEASLVYLLTRGKTDPLWLRSLAVGGLAQVGFESGIPPPVIAAAWVMGLWRLLPFTRIGIGW